MAEGVGVLFGDEARGDEEQDAFLAWTQHWSRTRRVEQAGWLHELLNGGSGAAGVFGDDGVLVLPYVGNFAFGNDATLRLLNNKTKAVAEPSSRSIRTQLRAISPAAARAGRGGDLAFQLNTTTSQWEQLLDTPERHELIETATHYYLSDPGRGLVHLFKKTGGEDASPRTHIVDRNGNTVTYSLPAVHDEATITGSLSVADGLGRSLTLGYATVGCVKMLTSVTDHSGRAWTFQYVNDLADNPSSTATPYVTLRSITDPPSGICTFTYQGDNRVTAKQCPHGNTPYAQAYSATLTESAVRSSPHQRNEDGVFRTDGLAVNPAVSGDEA